MILPRNDLSITYSSDVFIEYGDLLTTLSLFYDHIYLPYPYHVSDEARSLAYVGMNHASEEEWMWKKYNKWKNKYQALFDEGVLKTLDDAIPVGVDSHDYFNDIYKALTGDENTKFNRFGDTDLIVGEAALAVHSFRNDLVAPEFYWAQELKLDRKSSRLKDIIEEKNRYVSPEKITQKIVLSFLNRAIPSIKEMPCEDIIKYRDKLKDEREGFKYYLNENITKFMDLNNSGLSDEEAAEVIIKEKIIPKYAEIERVSPAKKIGLADKISDSIMSIDAAFWSPKFFVQLFNAGRNIFSDSASYSISQKTNEALAFRFIGRMEGIGR